MGTIRASNKAPSPPLVREWYVSEALHSFRRLKSVLGDMTEGEVRAALKLEHASRRRRTLLRVLTARAEQFHMEKFNPL